MQGASGKALLTWWLTLGAVGALMALTLLYSTPTVAGRQTRPASQEATAASGGSHAAHAPAAVTAPASATAATPAAALYSAPAHQPMSAVAPPYNPADVVD